MELWKTPFLLRPNPVDYLLPGGTMINAFLGRDTATDPQPSQLWVASVVQSSLPGARDSRSYLAPPWENMCFAQLLQDAPEAYLGAAHVNAFGATPGMLLKLLNTNQRLLVQSHPDDLLAKRYFGAPCGKTEAWYVLKTRGDAAVYLGFRPGITRNEFKKRIEVQDTAEILQCLHRFPIHAGDVICIPAGLPHAMGENSLVAEIQQPTDITLRAERFRPDGTELPERSMHSGIGVNAMLDCFDFTTRTARETRESFFVQPQAVTVQETALIPPAYEPLFGMHLLSTDGSYEKESSAFVSGLILEGSGTLCAGEMVLPLQQGSEFFIPAGVKQYTYHAEKPLRMLECFPPCASSAAKRPSRLTAMDTCGKLYRECARQNENIKVMGIPKTMDNDLAVTGHSPGYWQCGALPCP